MSGSYKTHLLTNSRTIELGIPAYNPRQHFQLYSAIDAGLWLAAETQLIFAYPTALHKHDVMQIMAILDGGMTFHHPSGTLELTAGDVVIIPADLAHRGAAHPQTPRCHMLDFRMEISTRSPLERMMNRLRGKLYHKVNTERLRGQCHALSQALERSEPERFAQVMVVVWSIFSACVQSSHEQSDHFPSIQRRDSRIAIAESYIREHLHEPIDLPTLAEVTHISVSQLSRLYRKHMRTTPARRIESLKIQRAYELLIDGTQSVKEIAVACGFQGTAQFTRAFRRTFGRTPSDARKSIVRSEVSQ